MPLRDDLLNPIAGDNPSGDNLRYDPVTDKVKEARREDIDAPQGEWKTALKTADFPLVIKLASDALAKRGKDLQLAVWLVDAHVRKEGFAMLAPSFRFLRELLEDFWDTLYPPIDDDGDMEVRAAPLEWLGNKLAEPLGFLPIVTGKLGYHAYQESRTVGHEADADTQEKQELREARIAEGKVTAEQFDEALDSTPVEALRSLRKDLAEALETLDALSQFCDEKFGGQTPSFLKTRGAIEEIDQTVHILLGRKPGGEEEEESAAAADDDVATALSAGEEDSGAAAAPAREEDAGEEEQPSFSGDEIPVTAPGDESGAGRQLAAICKFLREQDPTDPTPYLLLRNYAWGKLQLRAPMIDHDAIEAPPGDARVNLRRAFKESDWDSVIEQTEAAMLEPFGRTWLDMQRYTVNALEEQGYASTARVINNCFRIFLEALPDVLDLTLPDDTPAANAETKDWITNFVVIQKVPLKEISPEGEASSDGDSSSGDLSLDSGSSDDSSLSAGDSSSADSADSTGDTAAAEEEPQTFEMEEHPPILEPEMGPPSDECDEFGQALRAIRNGKTEDGLSVITALLSTERSGRARFRRRTQLAHLLMAAGKGKVAQPILDQLSQEIEERRLEDWEESEAVAYPLDLLFRCLGRAEEERRTALYARICRLDPVRAVNCSL